MRHTTTTYYGWQRDAPRFVRRFYWRMIPLLLPLGVALFTAPLLKPGVLPPFGFWSFTAVMFVVVVLAVLWAWAMRAVSTVRSAEKPVTSTRSKPPGDRSVPSSQPRTTDPRPPLFLLNVRLALSGREGGSGR